MTNLIQDILADLPSELRPYISFKGQKQNPHFRLVKFQEDLMNADLRGNLGNLNLEEHDEGLSSTINYLANFPVNITYQRSIGGLYTQRSNILTTQIPKDSFCRFLVQTRCWSSLAPNEAIFSSQAAQNAQIALELLCYRGHIGEVLQAQDVLHDI